ncbi:ABC transporter substrate-binding protein [Anaerocolumna aminovalerica]|jgi:branched-chain amino acid transport system substrate-binding protein|uniref:Amino acid/amide ABC transporter substrate-binding protein, HAAT family n=1 Tax=Anaerocolumna aminovalerica TaxID=1527 RepID=A0A1I5GNU1_9FIRM|nr:ABC transporter substrate-binding protein [Anaerocolumna aminovalerica]SFO37632.1 amino acid/amide ABC transporter substrate-binding protein, HAAT family [Anaerocolumna aminovalerica]
MKKMKKVLSLAMISAMTISLLAGCGKKEGSKETGSSADTIKIAVAAPMTGDNAEYGQGFLNAANMMAEEWNAKGGVLGKQIDIVPYDDKNSSEEAATIAQKIVSSKDIIGVIGHFASGVCMTAAPVYNENNIIEISPSASHKDYSGIGDYIFRNNTVISTEAKASLDIAVNDFGKKNIGIISIKTDWGTGTAQVIKDLATELEGDGVKIVAHEEVVEGSDDYSPAITKLNEAGADVVICAGMYNLVAPVAKQYKRVNPDIKIVGFSNAYSQQLIELGGEDVEGVGFPVIFFSGSEDPTIQAYVEKYKGKFGNEPSALTSQAYDSVGMLLTAIQEAGTTDSAKVREALTGVQYPGVAGDTKFDENGDVQKEFVKVTIENGKFVQMK